MQLLCTVCISYGFTVHIVVQILGFIQMLNVCLHFFIDILFIHSCHTCICTCRYCYSSIRNFALKGPNACCGGVGGNATKSVCSASITRGSLT